ncbi:hypothetical protein SFRURICE_006266 [Spodoptera frugiperda]|nr:hypothetical protein SFRURICE_006266 [Spodoptera frugiperda]
MCYPRKSTPCASLLTLVATNLNFFACSLPYIILNSAPTTLCTLFVIIMFKISEDLLSNNIVCLPVISLAAFVGNIIARRTGVVHLEPSYPGFGILAEHWLYCAV